MNIKYWRITAYYTDDDNIQKEMSKDTKQYTVFSAIDNVNFDGIAHLVYRINAREIHESEARF